MTQNSSDTVAGDLLHAARALASQPGDDTRGLWPRASALLARQSLEAALKTYWSMTAPGTEDASMRAQLLCLEGYLPAPVARQAYQVWTALSRASHHHAYELAPTREELLSWFDAVHIVVEQTERAWRK